MPKFLVELKQVSTRSITVEVLADTPMQALALSEKIDIADDVVWHIEEGKIRPSKVSNAENQQSK